MQRRKFTRSSRKRKPSVKRIVRKEISKAIETKEATFDHSGTGMSSIGNGGVGNAVTLFGHAANIAQGTADGQRIGNQITMRGIRYYFPIQNAVGERINHVRVLYVMPHRYFPDSGTAATITSDVFGTASWNMFSPVNTDKYKVLLDKFLYFRNVSNAGSTADSNPETKLIKGFLKINKKIQYDYEGISGATRPDQEVYLLAISDSTAIPNPGALGGYSRVFYKDA